MAIAEGVDIPHASQQLDPIVHLALNGLGRPTTHRTMDSSVLEGSDREFDFFLRKWRHFSPLVSQTAFLLHGFSYSSEGELDLSLIFENVVLYRYF
jgi:hypothetical protein